MVPLFLSIIISHPSVKHWTIPRGRLLYKISQPILGQMNLVTSQKIKCATLISMPKKPSDADNEEDSLTVEHLLQTIRIPSYPPNRSQWRKLELALKFINKSLKSTNKSKTSPSVANKKKTPKLTYQRSWDEENLKEKQWPASLSSATTGGARKLRGPKYERKYSQPMKTIPVKREACKTIRFLSVSLQNLL